MAPRTKPGFWPHATLILVALLAALPLWGPGMVHTRAGGDSPYLVQRAHQMLVNLQAGVFPVRWMPDAAYGLGYPFFSYYSALPYYLTGLLGLFGIDILTALKLVQTLGFVAAALAMAGWMHQLTGNRWSAWLAAVAYTVAPFHLVNVYVRGDSLSEFYAFVFYPLILWGLDGIRKDTEAANRKSALLRGAALGLAYAGLILSHNLSAMMFSPFVLLYLLSIAWRHKENRWPFLGLGIGGLGFGLLLSAWYWLPVMAEKDIIQTNLLTSGYYYYGRHFRAGDLVQLKALFDYGPRPGENTPFAMGLVQAVLGGFGALVLIVRGLRRQGEGHWAFCVLGLVISTTMITPLSKPLWDYLPLLSTVQFPWRFLSIQALFTAAATGAILGALGDTRASQSRRATAHITSAALIAVLLLASALLSLRPDRLPIAPSDVSVERLHIFELFSGNIGSSNDHEYLYQDAVPRPYTSDALIEPDGPPRAIPLDGAALEATLVQRRPTRQEWRVWGEGGVVAFPLLYWPGWKAHLNGDPLEVWPVQGSGYLALEVPPGEHTVHLQLGHTPVRAVAETASLCALVALAILVLGARPRVDWSSVVWHASMIVLPLLGLVLFQGSLDVTDQTTLDYHGDSDLTMDFVKMPYLHHNPAGISFGAGGKLAGYTLSAEELAPGDELVVTFDWMQTDDAYTMTVSLVSPAAVRHDVEPLAEATCALRANTCDRITLQLPMDVPRGVYLLELRLFGPQGEVAAEASEGKKQGTPYLRPVRVPHGPSLPADASVLAPFGSTIRLHTATVAQLGPRRLAVRLAWSAVRPTAANYGLSLRLLDGEGQLRVQLDTQPGYGFLPTSLWRPDELITDHYVLALPDDLPRDDGYQLEVLLYQVPTLEPVGRAMVGRFPLPLAEGTPFDAQRPPRVLTLPPLAHPVDVDFGGVVRLAGYDLEMGQGRADESLQLTLWWYALKTPAADYTVFVHLFDPATEELIAQSDAQPRLGTYPTSWWTGGEVISDTVTLPLADVPDGCYRLAVGLYDQTATRLQATGSDGQPIPDNRLILPLQVTVGE
jgi:hypothetical protein